MNLPGIFSGFLRFFEHRRHPRYVVKDGTFLIIAPASKKGHEKKVQIIDISHGGMAFIYQGAPSELETSGIVKLITKEPFGNKIDFDTTSDIPLPSKLQRSEEQLRQRGVKFKWMGFFEESHLKEFIDQVKLFEK